MRRILIGLLCVAVLAGAAPDYSGAAQTTSSKITYQQLRTPGEKVFLDVDHYFTFGFDKQPKLGTAIMKVEIFTLDGQRNTSFVVKGDADMPSMRGAHTTGDKQFSLSAKKVYLLPVRLVMPGDWEVRFTFEKKGKVVLRGAYLFDI